MSIRNILIIAANPRNTKALRWGEEVRGIKESLRRARERDNFKVESVLAARYEDVRKALLDFGPNIVHFCGHCQGKAGIQLEDEAGIARPVPLETLADLVGLFSDRTECVVLNACCSEEQAQAIAKHVEYAIGMKTEIPDEEAIKFSVAFYDALGAGRSIRFAFETARNALTHQEHTTPVLIGALRGRMKPKIASRPDFVSYNSDWVGRKSKVDAISRALQGSCRIALVLGLSGIGKTALGERLAIELETWLDNDWSNAFKRANFDYEGNPTDFESVAKRWLEEWGIVVSPVERRPEYLLELVLGKAFSQRVLFLIDSFERLLGVDQESRRSGEIVDPWWERFFLRILSNEACKSRIIITSQDLPNSLANHRNQNYVLKEVLYGLSEEEQVELFERTGFDTSAGSEAGCLLRRLGKAYDGHPLSVKVMIGEINCDFGGDALAYWLKVKSKVEKVERDLDEAKQNAKSVQGMNDDWQLHQLTRTVHEQVNRGRLESAFNRLKEQAKDAYIMICYSAVYRKPVEIDGWLIQLSVIVERLERIQCPPSRAENALEELKRRFLVEESLEDHVRMIGLHNLVRSVALSEQRRLLASPVN